MTMVFIKLFIHTELVIICSKSKNTTEELVRLDQLAEVFELKSGKNDEVFGEPLIIRYCTFYYY